ncbi:MAG: hypothetical protein LBE89_04680 [Helicobacteraceae bacterium]|jgi:hypothetical protein|nr:hypothetical protein [Helicobacteraceae bacterium]
MFENDYTFNGKHATYIKYLVDEAKLYERYIDVLMNGVVFGLLYNRTSQRDRESQDRARVYADAFANCREDCMFLYRMVMLLDKNGDMSDEQTIDRAFRDDAEGSENEKVKGNLDVFFSYVLGGIEVLFETLTDGCTAELDYIDNAFDKMKSFREEIMGVRHDEKLSELIRN